MTNIRELIARAVCGAVAPMQGEMPTDRMVERKWKRYAHSADAILAALDAAGIVLVPRHPTPEMVRAGGTSYFSMADCARVIAASPYARKEPT